MSTEATSRITTKLFIGCQVNSELRMHLNYSERWKQEQVIKQEGGVCLERVRHNDKEFLGLAFENQLIALEQIDTVTAKLRKTIAEYCPELNPDGLRFSLFSQLFLS